MASVISKKAIINIEIKCKENFLLHNWKICCGIKLELGDFFNDYQDSKEKIKEKKIEMRTERKIPKIIYKM